MSECASVVCRGRDVDLVRIRLVNRCRLLNRSIDELDQALEQRVAAIAPALLELPGCGAVTAGRRAPWPRLGVYVLGATGSYRFAASVMRWSSKWV